MEGREPNPAYNAFVTRRRVCLTLAVRSLIRRFCSFDGRRGLCDRPRLGVRPDDLLVTSGPASPTREARQPCPGEEQARESGAPRQGLGRIGKATLPPHKRPPTVEEPGVRPPL